MNTSVKQIILVPALISLAVTALRLMGELLSWSQTLFNPEAGGGGAPVGISWLVPIFGVYFSFKLVKAGDGPRGAGRVIGVAMLAVLAAIGIGFVLTLVLGQGIGSIIVSSIVMSAVSLAIASRVWPQLFRTLLAYGLAARIPVAILMFFAIMGDWGTHYDVPPSPDFPQMSWVLKWVSIGLVPQLTIWIAFTVVVGMLFGGVAAFYSMRKTAV